MDGRFESSNGSVAALSMVAILSAGASRAQTTTSTTREVETYVVQERLFRLGLELNAGVGLLPLNAFDKGFMVEGSVSYHFSNLWAWEIAQGGYVIANLGHGAEGPAAEQLRRPADPAVAQTPSSSARTSSSRPSTASWPG